MMPRRWGLWSIVIVRLALGAASPGCGAGAASGAAGAHGAAGASGTAGASGSAGAAAAGTGDAAGVSGSAGTTGAAGAGDASADAPALPTDARDDTTGPGVDACGPMRLDRVAPDLLLLLDRSGSMSTMLDGTTCPVGVPCVTRWGEVTKGVNQIVQETESSVRWGLKYFANSNACSVTASPAVAVGPKNATTIAASIAATLPGGDTPTRLAITSAGAYLQALADPNPKVLLLATDGLPNCMPGSTNITNDDSAGTINAIKTLADSGIPVYVIGIGTDPILVQNLQQMAMAGGRPRAGDPAYYPVESSADLVDALRAIGAQSAPCTYALPAEPLNPNDVVIKAASVAVPHDTTHAEGWDYGASTTSIQLFGTWCTKDHAGALTNVEESGACAGMR